MSYRPDPDPSTPREPAGEAGRAANAGNGSATLTEELARRAHHGVDQAAGVASSVERQVRSRGGELSTEADERLRHLARDAEHLIRENPVAAIAVAFAAGIVLDSLLRR